jgi:hypothetical protein
MFPGIAYPGVSLGIGSFLPLPASDETAGDGYMRRNGAILVVWGALAAPAIAAPECDDRTVIAALKTAYANYAPNSLFPRRPPIDAFGPPAETAFIEDARDARYPDRRFCQAEVSDVTGARLGLRYVLKGKDWEWFFGHDMDWCFSNTPRTGSGDSTSSWDFNSPQCAAMAQPAALPGNN